MRSPGRAHARHMRMVPPALAGLPPTERGVSVPTRPAKHHGGGSPLCLLLLSPGPHNTHALPPYTMLEPTKGMEWGGEAERRLHFRHGPLAPLGERDTVSRVWALSPLGTTDGAAFGRQASGAWSVALYPPPPLSHSTRAKVVRAWTCTLGPLWPYPQERNWGVVCRWVQ